MLAYIVEKLEPLNRLFQASINRLLLIFGSLFVFLSFITASCINGQWSFDLVRKPNLWWLVVGLVLLVAFVGRLILTKKPKRVTIKKIDNGRRILVGASFQIDVIHGGIEHVQPCETSSAIVLPSTTAFDDECINDKGSSLGAFFQEHFPSGINQIQSLIRQEACKLAGMSEEDFRETSEGTTILLNQPLGSSYKILITAVTRLSSQSGIKADTLSLMASIKNVCRLAAQHRFTHLYTPVLGTGHGGLDFSSALSLLLVQTANCVLHEGTHHIKHLSVVVYDPDGRKSAIVERVVNSVSQILEGD